LTLAYAKTSSVSHLDFQQWFLHPQHCAIDVDQLCAQAHKVIVVIVDHFDQLLLKLVKIGLQLAIERFQWYLRPTRCRFPKKLL
jgi:hypothetical protein